MKAPTKTATHRIAVPRKASVWRKPARERPIPRMARQARIGTMGVACVTRANTSPPPPALSPGGGEGERVRGRPDSFGLRFGTTTVYLGCGNTSVVQRFTTPSRTAFEPYFAKSYWITL